MIMVVGGLSNKGEGTEMQCSQTHNFVSLVLVCLCTNVMFSNVHFKILVFKVISVL